MKCFIQCFVRKWLKYIIYSIYTECIKGVVAIACKKNDTDLRV